MMHMWMTVLMMSCSAQMVELVLIGWSIHILVVDGKYRNAETFNICLQHVWRA